MKHLFAAFALCAAVGSAHAAATDGSFAVDGPGNQSCAEFTRALDARDQSAVVAYAAWTEGFMTGVNVFREDTFDVTPWQTTPLLMARMKSFCQKNPDVVFVNALGRLIATLMPHRQVESSAMVQARNAGRAVILPEIVLTSVRARLEDTTGETIPTPPGGFDDHFAALIEAFQKDEGLPASGLPDQATLNALMP